MATKPLLCDPPSPERPWTVASAAAIMVGSELLSGKIQDENSLALAKSLRSRGVKLGKIVTLPDDLAIIATEIEQLSSRFDVVFTSGGVGPTHDDVTIAAAAHAFGLGLKSSPMLEALLRKSYGENYDEVRARMAIVPETAHLVATTDVRWPTVIVGNVWLLPGVPEIFRVKLGVVRSCLRGTTRFYSKAVYTQLEEVELKQMLDEVVAKHPKVEVGSYPKWFNPLYKTKVTFDAADSSSCEAAMQAFLVLLPNGEPQKIE